ncbi:MAG: MoaD/ThiS family protein [Anaerolineales bacterium]|jgi:MoaD family protein
MSVVRIPTPLRAYTDGSKQISVEAATVEQALQALSARYPSLAPHLYDQEGKLRSYVNLFVNDDNIRDLHGIETPVQDGDQIMILPSIAGGGGC